MEVSAYMKQMITETVKLVDDGRFGVTSPLLLDGSGVFWSKNGQVVNKEEVLKQHAKMQECLDDIFPRIKRLLNAISA